MLLPKIQNQNKIQTLKIDAAIDYLNHNKANLTSKLSKKGDVKPEFDKITQEKIINSDQLLTVIPVEANDKDSNDRILLLKVNNEIKSVVFSMFPKKGSSDKFFTGKIMIRNLSGDFITGFQVYNGDLTTQFVKTNENSQKSFLRAVGEETGLREVIFIQRYHKSYNLDVDYFDWTFSNGGPSGDGEYSDSNLAWDSGDSGGGGVDGDQTTCQQGYIKDEYGNCVVDEQIINELTGKEKCLNDLLDKNGDSFVKNLLANFQGKSEFDIKIVSKDKVFSKETGLEINGRTLPPVNKTITIEISASKTDQNAVLEGARTILHEYIHADIFRKLNTSIGTNEEILDFKKTYEAYGNQHSTMGALYINSMKEALKGFHKNALTDDYNKYTNYYGEAPTDAFYEALAWSGLRASDVKSWTDLPADKRAAIEVLASRVTRFSTIAPCSN
jgi:hypothetical protein